MTHWIRRAPGLRDRLDVTGETMAGHSEPADDGTLPHGRYLGRLTKLIRGIGFFPAKGLPDIRMVEMGYLLQRGSSHVGCCATGSGRTATDVWIKLSHGAGIVVGAV